MSDIHRPEVYQTRVVGQASDKSRETVGLRSIKLESSDQPRISVGLRSIRLELSDQPRISVGQASASDLLDWSCRSNLGKVSANRRPEVYQNEVVVLTSDKCRTRVGQASTLINFIIFFFEMGLIDLVASTSHARYC